MSATEAVRVANEAFYLAHEDRDLGAMASVWEHSDRVVCVHPGWPVMSGWQAVEATWARIFEGPGRNQFILTDESVEVGADLAWITVVENLIDRGQTHSIAATNIFVRGEYGCKMVAHHGSPVLANVDPR